jgi:MFS family permease
LIVRRLVPRVGELIMTRLGTVFMTIGLVLIGLSGYSNSRTMLYSVLPVAVVGFSAVTPSLQSLLSRHTSASEQGGVLGLGQSIAALARILGPLLGLTLTDRNIVWPYWAGAALMGVSVLLTLALQRPPATAESPDEQPESTTS